MPVFDFDDFPVLETERLILREILPADVDAIFRIRGDGEVTRYNIGAPYGSLDQASDLIAAMDMAYRDHSEIRWGLTLKKGDSSVIGICGYNYWNRLDARASVGYDMARAFWGQGFMTEALDTILRFGFERMELNRIEADADVRNAASARVLMKLGFRREGIQRDQFFQDGAFHDLVLFSLLHREFLNRTANTQNP